MERRNIATDAAYRRRPIRRTLAPSDLPPHAQRDVNNRHHTCRGVGKDREERNMEHQRQAVPLSRRRFLSGAGALAAAILLAACGGSATPHRRRRLAAAAGKASAEPSAGGAAVPAASASTAPTPDLKIVAGKFNVWFSANWNRSPMRRSAQSSSTGASRTTSRSSGSRSPARPLILQKESAALAAGQPPEIDNNNRDLLVYPGRDGRSHRPRQQIQGSGGRDVPDRDQFPHRHRWQDVR